MLSAKDKHSELTQQLWRDQSPVVEVEQVLAVLKVGPCFGQGEPADPLVVEGAVGIEAAKGN